MMTYHKRNGTLAYNHGQSGILTRILEVIFKKETAFWLFCILLESILPLNFYANSLYPQTLLDYTNNLFKTYDRKFFDMCGNSINLFCIKSFYCLFTNLETDVTNRC